MTAKKDEEVTLDCNVNLTIRMSQREYDALLAEAESDEDRNDDDTPEVHAMWTLSNELEGEEFHVSSPNVPGYAWIAFADPPTKI